jgi:iron(III) transport system substrate-binding protein
MHKILLFVFGLSILASQPTLATETINIFTYRQPALLAPMLEAYTKETGIEFKTVYAPKGLVARLQAEGQNAQADMVITVDISRVKELADSGLLAPLSSPVIARNVPAHLRAEDDSWTALSLRARILAISKKRVAKDSLQDIEQLAEPEWQGRVCTRKGSHVYNRALLASLIAHHGEEDARAWAKGLVGNLARRPQGNDRAQAKAIYAGECDVALMNTYYFGKMKFNKSEPEQRVWADSIELVFFNQQGRGQHVNISAGGILKTSKNKDRARAFLAWLTSAEAQRLYTEINYEYPVNSASAPSDEVASWGSFKMDKLALPEIARLSPVAQRIINSTGW